MKQVPVILIAVLIQQFWCSDMLNICYCYVYSVDVLDFSLWTLICPIISSTTSSSKILLYISCETDTIVILILMRLIIM